MAKFEHGKKNSSKKVEYLFQKLIYITLFSQSKAGRDKRNRRRREIYRLGGEEVSIARNEKQRMDRKKRRSKMSDKDYKDFLDRRNKYRRELRIRKQ